MKKIIAILMIAALMLTLTGCFGNNNNASNEPATEAPALSTYPKDFIGLQQYLIDHGLVPYANLSAYRTAAATEPATEAATTAESATEAAATEAAATAATEAATAATEAATAAPTEANSARTTVYYDLLGAADGVRFALSSTAFIELYDFSGDTNATATKILADIKDDGKITLIEGMDQLTGVISKSGKYVALYNEKNGYDYDKITKELENW